MSDVREVGEMEICVLAQGQVVLQWIEMEKMKYSFSEIKGPF